MMIQAPMRSAMLLTMMVLLGACSNRVVSETPWFSKEAEADAPHLRPGLWVATSGTLVAGSKMCRFDERKPSETWPDCASSYLVRDGELLQLAWLDSTKHGRTLRTYEWERRTHLLATGSPRISQVEGCPEVQREFSNLPDGSSKPKDPYAYCYDAVRPTMFDRDGHITATLTWPILCGPWPSKDQEGPAVTAMPFAGLHIVHSNCIAESEAALRNAAALSEAVSVKIGFVGETHWVRDGYH